ncbi:tectonin beta-propeller repeat-containing protein 1 isoform X2 [Syngnathus typhle]|uniref:tectonin beta-propeller repeat-containing protein 1 isoform X2 n=1 Tax=Syngnathus typhle TaxID=161592 RepID=UPI002A6B5AFE|nr:tectonin beta-propeller repeat-containing protein 1 isoform X2 [Syngnathus typhle]
MPTSRLWAVDVHGCVYSLSTAGQQWERCHDAQMAFKRVTAAQQCCWGIACDNKIYLNVHASDVHIRFQEETYENQRWNPVDGFSERLLPSDRWQWSDVTGLHHQPPSHFQLPSSSWEWEGDWYVDENFEGEPTEKEGWTYSVDFPAFYTKDKKWNSCVRRRRWLRHRRYKAMDSWAEIPSQKTSLPDPFSDISCGGWEITEEPRGLLSLWAVSLQGKVWYREGIHHHNPEGSTWQDITLPGEVIQISCGPGDLVWAVLWEGQMIVREGVSRDNPRGTDIRSLFSLDSVIGIVFFLSGSSWSMVDSPDPDVAVMHVAVGVNVVWALTKDNKVWFRRGVNPHNPRGSGWISMVGEMLMINVGLNDQVWAIGSEDRAVYFRQGVTASELSGKTWKAIAVLRDGDRPHSSASSQQSAGCYFSESHPPSGVESDTEKTEEVKIDTPKGPIPKVTSDSFISQLVSDRDPVCAVDPQEESIPEEGDKSLDVVQTVDPQWSNVDLEVPLDNVDTCSLSSLPALAMEDPYGEDGHPLWAWVSGGGCSVDSHSQLNWFHSTMNTSLLAQSVQSLSLSFTSAQMATWRKQIFEQLGERTKREVDEFRHYEQAVEQCVWVKKGTMQWWRDLKPHKWVDVHFALEQFSGPEGNKDGILFVYYNNYEEKKYLHAFINEVTILVPVFNDAKHTFAIYTPERIQKRWPIRVAAATEEEMHDWLALLSASCCDARGIRGPPSKQAIWSITCKGDIFVSEPTPSLEAMPYPTPCDQMFWRQIGGHLRVVESNSVGIVWGIGYDHTAWVNGGGTEHGYTQTDVKSVYIYENQRWNPVTGYTNRGLPTDRYMWSDASGLHERTKTSTKPPSPQWAWVSEWAIDYGVSGGTDREGWQYAADFPAWYHGYKTMKDFVRRRRWARKCKLTTTGPWQEVPPIQLSDVSIMPCGPDNDVIPVWAISDKGDVLCRLGVTALTPAGTSWLHVGTDQPFKSISIGAARQLWAIARDGSAFFRGSVFPQTPAGECWYHIPSPTKQKLKQVSVGRTSVFVVDDNGHLWYRKGLTPSYPQGSSWEYVSNNVRKVTVGPFDQVWIIADKVQGSHSLSRGTVCHRLGIHPLEPKGQSWDYGIGGGWDHISVRGNTMEPPHFCLSALAEPRVTSFPS